MQQTDILTADIPPRARFAWLTIKELQARQPEKDGAQISHEALSRIIGVGRRQTIRLCDILEARGFIRVTRGARNSHVTNTYHVQMSHSPAFPVDGEMSHSAKAVDGQMSHKESVVVDSIKIDIQNKQQLCDTSPGESAQPGDREGVERRADIDPVVAEVFHPRTAAEMITRYGADRVKEVCAVAKEKGRNPGGLARAALENYWQMPLPLVYPTPDPSPKHREGKEQLAWREYGARINVDYEVILEERRREAEAQKEREESANRAREAAREAAALTPEAKLWEAAYNQLSLQLDRASFQTWLRGAVFVGMDDGKYIIQVKNGYARDMLQHRLYRNVRRVLRDVTGQEVELRFVAAGEERNAVYERA